MHLSLLDWTVVMPYCMVYPQIFFRDFMSIFTSRKFAHITPLLEQLHWLPVEQRIMFKICLLTWNALHGNAPSYIQHSLFFHIIAISKDSVHHRKMFLTVPSGTTKTYGDRAFTTAAPTVWNRLPQTIRLCDSRNSFKTWLKTHLFQKVYTC